jgi:hypothetical protein
MPPLILIVHPSFIPCVCVHQAGSGTIALLREQRDLCDVFKCPIHGGARAEARITQSVPAIAPSGNYVLTARLFDDSDAHLMCVRAEFKL